MTSDFERKVTWFVKYDICVIVDNYVEIGDFSIFCSFLAKILWLFFS